jgi:hypothetical protein
MRCIERALDVLFTRVGDLAERLARRRCQVLSVLAGRRRTPLAPYEVLIALVQLYRAAGLARRVVGG